MPTTFGSPLLFDGDTVKIEWRDSWKLEDYE